MMALAPYYTLLAATAILLHHAANAFSPPVSSPTALLCIRRITPSSASTLTTYNTKSRRNYRNTVFILRKLATDADTTTQDEEEVSDSDDSSSILDDDEFLDPDNLTEVVCARGLCVPSEGDDGDFDWHKPPPTSSDTTVGASSVDTTIEQKQSIVDQFLTSYLGPRLLLAFASILYGTNFPLGAMMNESLPPSAATSARMLLASVALLPFLFKLKRELAPMAVLCGCFTALGYITQSLSLVDTSPATVAFLGAATVIVCPTLEVIINKKDMSLTTQPQTWLAATLCILGVGILELYDPTGATATSDIFSQIGIGDGLAILQAVGFGTSFFLTERMMTKVPGQALPITAVQVSMAAFICMIWSISDGWIGSSPEAQSYGFPAMFFEPTLRTAACAVAWTGLVTTALNRFIETTALGKMKSAEASVILATEPLWASLFAALWLKEDFGANDYIGGALIVGACLATSLKREDFEFLFGGDGGDNDGDDRKGMETEGSFE